MCSRDDLLSAVRGALEPLEEVTALCEGGSVAFGAEDAWSDVDLIADIADGSAARVFEAVEAGLAALAPIEAQYVASEGPIPQRFYRLRGCPAYRFVDLTLRPAARSEAYAEIELHGVPRVLFDKEGHDRTIRLDPAALQREIAEATARLRARHAMFADLARKELLRGRTIDALHFHRGMVFGPLVHLLRIRYCPERHGFGLRYLDRDLPPGIASELRELAFVRDAEDLAAKDARARAWIDALLAALPRGITPAPG